MTMTFRYLSIISPNVYNNRKNQRTTRDWPVNSFLSEHSYLPQSILTNHIYTAE